MLKYCRSLGHPHVRTGLTKVVSAPAMTTHAPHDEMVEKTFLTGRLLSEKISN